MYVTTVGTDLISYQFCLQAFEFEENVFMYDEDDTSGSVTSHVLRIDAKAGDTYVTPGFISFDQTVTTPNATRMIPNDIFDPEDASEFSYHKVLYSKNTDYLCLIIEPVEPHNISQYDVYIRLKQAPTIIEYDIKFSVTKYEKWKYCVGPAEMKGYVGLVYVAVGISSFSKYHIITK